MRFTVRHAGSGFAAIRVELKKGETVMAESDAMVTRSENVSVEGRLSGGVLGGLARMFLTNESLFFQELTAVHGDDNDVLLAPPYPGDVIVLHLNAQETYIIAQGAFLCAERGVDISTYTQRLAQGLLSKQGLFLMRARGPGTLGLAAYGAIEQYELRGGEVRDVDNGHLVAWTGNMDYELVTASRSLMSSMTSGEGLVCRFRGPGRVYVQTRNLQGLRTWMDPRRPSQSANNVQGCCALIVFLVIALVFMGVIALIVFNAGESGTWTYTTGGGSRGYRSHGRIGGGDRW